MKMLNYTIIAFFLKYLQSKLKKWMKKQDSTKKGEWKIIYRPYYSLQHKIKNKNI